MTLLPVVARELRVASRRPWTYWGRVFAGGVALLLSVWLAWIGGALGATGSGEPLFYSLSVPALGFAFLAGILYSADSISGEKREGTLGLLFLTDLRGHDVTLGKLAGTSLGAIYGLVAMLPFLAISLLLGGVTGADYGRMTLLLLTTLITSLAMGILASVLTRDVRHSALLAFLFMLAVFLGAPCLYGIIGWAIQRYGGSPEALQAWENGWYQNLSPAVGFGFAGAKSYKTGATRYWISIGFTAVVGLIGLLVASWRLPHAWQDTADRSPSRGPAAWLRRLRFSGPDAFPRFRRDILEQNPVTWLSARHRFRAWLPWLFLFAVAAVTLTVGSWQSVGWWDIEVMFALSVFVHVVLKFWMANEAPRQFLDDRRTGAMELLLSTPLTTAEILSGQWRALYRQFLGPMAVVLAMDFFWIFTGAMDHRDGTLPTLAIVWLLRMVLLVADMWCLGWTGFRSGMTGRGRATTTSLVFRVLILPWVLWVITATVIGLSTATNSGENSVLWLLIGSWFLLAMGTDLVWVNVARSSLMDSFREAATRRPGETRGWFQRRTATTTTGSAPGT